IDSVKGQVTGSLTRVLEQDQMLETVTFYDNKYRVTQVSTENHKGGKDIAINTYMSEVSPLITKTLSTHTSDSYSGMLSVTEEFTYDHSDRVLKQTHSINGDETPVTLAENSYNELGQLKDKQIGNNIQQVDYDYNIQGWITMINNGSTLGGNDKFGMELQYEEAGLYSGNIGMMKWKSIANAAGNNNEQVYAFTYDQLNRLDSANYSSANKPGFFNVSGISYDANGNIERMTRHKNDTVMDQMIYIFEGNRLLKVDDAGDKTEGFIDGVSLAEEYLYDASGNMIADKNKGITSIAYNHLNLPTQVTMSNGEVVTYIYDAAGIKLQKQHDNGSRIEVTDYIAGKHYKDDGTGSGSKLSFLQHAEGRVVYNTGNFDYEYNLTDHLGNIRVTLDEAGNAIQRQDYYPFGLTFNDWSDAHPENLYTYNSKEEQEEWGLIDYGARMYDAQLGRFFTQDRFAEVYTALSPYNYTANNPINFIDVNGDYITIAGQDDEGHKYSVLYENGKAYHYSVDQDGNITKGDEYDGENEFISNAVADLNSINSTVKGKKRIGDLQSSETQYSISAASRLKDSRASINDDGNVSIKYYQDGGVIDGVRYNNSSFALGHEIQHAWDHDQAGDTYIKNMKYRGHSYSEKNAVEFENYLRAQAGETRMRMSYGGTKFFDEDKHSPSYFLNITDPLRSSESYIIPTATKYPGQDATYFVPNYKPIGVKNTKTGRYVDHTK
ncbi:MAG: RHS repeat-associated core domain-containing protein, partial [Cyclobacteriaceae bacterium]